MAGNRTKRAQHLTVSAIPRDTQLIVTKGLSGWGGIRTPGGPSPTAVFKTAPLDHSGTHPVLIFRGFLHYTARQGAVGVIY